MTFWRENLLEPTDTAVYVAVIPPSCICRCEVLSNT